VAGVRNAIEIRNLSVTFNGFNALDAINITVREGESFGLVGESGSGKSTMLRAIAGLAPVAGGTILLGGKYLQQRRDKSFYRSVQMVFQDPYGSLHPRQSVDRALREPLSIHGFDNSDARIRRALDEVGLGVGFRYRYPHELSGGQRQRVAIARALILEPSFLLLDEPTSALDTSVQAEVLNLLEQVRRDHHLTFIMVSHDLGVVTHICDRLLVMQQGRAVEYLTTAHLSIGQVSESYTKKLLAASVGFSRTPLGSGPR
jgi:peptide/nickel transport system ATP-binding protein